MQTNEKYIYSINQKLIVINPMVIENNSDQRIILKILKDFASNHTITSLSMELKLSRVGIWKILKRLESQEIITLTKTGEGKTNTYTARLNWKNQLTEKILAIALVQEAQKYQRWIFNFAELEKEVEFLILFGSTLHSPKEANDIDIVGIAKEKSIGKIKDIVLKVQKSQEKDIHSINFTEEEFEKELAVLENKIYLDALRKGVVLFGQDNFIKFMRNIS